MINLEQAYRAARRGLKVKAGVALTYARRDLAAYALANVEESAAYAELAAAREIDPRRYVPAMVAANDRVRKARAAKSALIGRLLPKGCSGMTLGAAFIIGGRGAGWAGQWCENPPFRLVGFASDLVRMDHTGHYCDSDGEGDIARGVVYQMTAKNGRARYVSAIADPCNDGMAALCLDGIETAADSSEDAAEQAKRDAANFADDLAARYAEHERDWQEAYRQGSSAAELAKESTAAGKAWVRAIRDLRALMRARHGLGIYGVNVKLETAALVVMIRARCEVWQESRRAAHAAIDDRPSRLDPLRDAWQEGFASV